MQLQLRAAFRLANGKYSEINLCDMRAHNADSIIPGVVCQCHILNDHQSRRCCIDGLVCGNQHCSIAIQNLDRQNMASISIRYFVQYDPRV